MRAAVRDRYGGPEVVELRDLTGAGAHGATRSSSASVPRRSTAATSTASSPKPGFVRLFIGLRAPRNPRIGLDVAGVVEAVGPDVDPVPARATRVFADLFSLGQGAFAEYVCAPERAFAADPGRDVVRGRGDAAALGDPRRPGAATPRPAGRRRPATAS